MKYSLFSHENTIETPRMLAHRGFTPVAPENSLVSFRAAAKRGFWSIETDIHKTSDGVLVCCHNPTTGAHYNEDLPIAETPYAELAKLYMVNGKRVETYTREQLAMPTFAQYLDICEQSGIVPFIECKAPIVEEILTTLRRRDMIGCSVFSAIPLDYIREARHLDRDIFVHHIFSNREKMLEIAEMGNAGLSYNCPDLDLIPDGIVELTHSHGVKLCFRAADTPEVCRRMIALGVDYFPTNKVEPTKV